jgi:outer membrane receptor protein involved in Fe transport
MSITISRALRFAFAFALLLSFSTSALAQLSIGKISGIVVDNANRDALPAASIRVDGTVMGAMANDRGEYFILNVPPGTYTMIVNVIGYIPQRVIEVEVHADLTTILNFELDSTILESAEEVIVVATRDLVEKSLTSTRTIVTADELQALPIVNIAEVVLTTAGSFAGNLRGGRAQDQQTTLDGSTVTMQHNNSGQAFTVNPYMIQELEVKTGTFNAEYVNALSGITSVVTREGGAQFNGNFEYRTLGQKGLNWTKPPSLDVVDAYRTGTLSENDLRKVITNAIAATNEFNNDPARAEDGFRLKDPFEVLDMTGPVDSWQAIYSRENYYWDYDRVIPEVEAINWSYLTEGRNEAARNSRSVSRVFTPDKHNQFAINNRTEKRPVQLDFGMGGPMGSKLSWFFSGRFAESWGRAPDEYGRLMNVFVKTTYRPRTSMKLSFSGLVEDNGFFSKKGQRGAVEGTTTGFTAGAPAYGWKYNLDGRSQDFKGRIHINTSFTHTVSPNTFYELRLSHLREYNERYHPKYGKEPLPSITDAFVGSVGYYPLEEGGRPQVNYLVFGDEPYAGVDVGNYTSIRPFKTDMNFNITSQITSNHQIKGGIGVNLYDFEDSRRGPARGNAVPLFNELNVTAGTSNLPLSGWQAHVYPWEYYGYIQDRIEYGSLVVNAGVRLDFFNANANAINPFRPRPGPDPNHDDPEYRTLEPSMKTGLAPRLGISHPITDRAALHYSYGVFNQRPTLQNLYNGLVQTSSFERNHGNPDLPFQKATNYEMGIQSEIYPGYYLDVTGYFRDVNNLPVQWLFAPDGGFIGGSQREISILLPTFAQDSRGLEASFRRQMANRFSVRANYTLSFTSDLTLTDAALGRNGEPVLSFAHYNEGLPVASVYVRKLSNLDRRHRMVTNLLIELPYGINASFLAKAQSGHIYRTQSENVLDPLGLLQASRRSPWTWTTDMYAQKTFDLGGMRLGVFTQINNIFDRTNIYSIGNSPASDRFVLRGDPVGLTGGPLTGIGTQSNNPRDIWVGVNVSW